MGLKFFINVLFLRAQKSPPIRVEGWALLFEGL
jgi:hypothetical protein